MPCNKPYISVIIPVYNGGNFLQSCLKALFDSSYSSFEVLVVDDGSTDDSAEIARRGGAKILSTAQRQSGPAAARNLAAQEAAGDILLFVDADVVVKADTITQVAAIFKNQADVAALFGSYDDAPAEQNFLSQYRNLLHHFVHQNSNREASTFWAGLGAVRRGVFQSVGGFDCEQFSVPSIEDIELGARLRSSGHRILLAKEIQARHLKKWRTGSMLQTDVFCRAVPWSKLILTSHGLINDMNLKTNDRLSAMLVGFSIALVPFIFWQPLLLVLLFAVLFAVLILNRKIFRFFLRKKGIIFAACAFPWQLLYFFYSGATFVCCWFRYALPFILGFGKRRAINEIRHIN